MQQIGLGALVAVVFVAGWGWGQWFAERRIRAERAALERGRVMVSMPMDADNASSMMGLLHDMVGQVEREKAEAPAQQKAR